ncbi:MAG: hypothetical protein N2C14_19695 [Planctomycetales bacterium]
MDCVPLALRVLEWTPHSEHWQSQWHTVTNLFSTYFRESNTDDVNGGRTTCGSARTGRYYDKKSSRGRPSGTRKRVSPMKISHAIGAGIGCVFAGGLIGAAIGYVIGTVMPGYYHTIMPYAVQAGIRPRMIGMVLGLGQGSGAGLVAGVLLIGGCLWWETRNTAKHRLEDVVRQVAELRDAVSALQRQLEQNSQQAHTEPDAT